MNISKAAAAAAAAFNNNADQIETYLVTDQIESYRDLKERER